MSIKKEFKTFLKVYLFSWVFTFCIFLLNLFNPNTSFSEVMDSYWQIISSGRGLIFVHIVILIFYLLFLIGRYFIRVGKKRGARIAILRFMMLFVIPISILFAGVKELARSNAQEDFEYQWNYSVENKTDSIQDLFLQDGKHRGMTVYDFGRRNSSSVEELTQNNV